MLFKGILAALNVYAVSSTNYLTSFRKDTDGDGLADNEELSTVIGYNEVTDPNKSDTDNDGLSDYEEINAVFKSNGVDTSWSASIDVKRWDDTTDQETQVVIQIKSTNPLDFDTDDDLLDDAKEIGNTIEGVFSDPYILNMLKILI